MTTVSVVIPAYNASAWIGETLDSVFAQDYKDFEVIVVDDGSTDDTASLVARYNSVRYIYKPNGGQASARNVGIRAAQGDYIAFLDADDIWLADKLGLQIELLQQSGLSWVYSDVFIFEEQTRRILHTGKAYHKKLPDGNIFVPLIFGNFIASPTPVVKRTIFDEIGYFDESKLIQKREDWDMWLRISARYNIGLVDQPLARYRVHRTSSTGNENPEISFVSKLAVIQKNCPYNQSHLKNLRNQAIGHVYINTGNQQSVRGNIVAAKKFYARSVRMYPLQVRAYILWISCLLGNFPMRMGIGMIRWFRYILSN